MKKRVAFSRKAQGGSVNLCIFKGNGGLWHALRIRWHILLLHVANDASRVAGSNRAFWLPEEAWTFGTGRKMSLLQTVLTFSYLWLTTIKDMLPPISSVFKRTTTPA